MNLNQFWTQYYIYIVCKQNISLHILYLAHSRGCSEVFSFRCPEKEPWHCRQPFPSLLLNSQISVKLPNHLILGLSFSSLLITISEECTTSHLNRLSWTISEQVADVMPIIPNLGHGVVSTNMGSLLQNSRIRRSALTQQYLQNSRCLQLSIKKKTNQKLGKIPT